jgi:hypothetical protein
MTASNTSASQTLIKEFAPTLALKISKNFFRLLRITALWKDAVSSVPFERPKSGVSPAPVMKHTYLYGEGEIVNATHAELCYFLDRIRLCEPARYPGNTD